MSAIALIISALVNIGIAAMAFPRIKKNLLLRSFFLLSLCFFSLNMVSLGTYIIKDVQTLLVWSKVFRFGVFLLPSNFLYFSLLFSQSYKKKYFWLIQLSFGLSITLAIANIFYDTNFISTPQRFIPQSNILYVIFISQLLGTIIFGLTNVLKKYKQTTLLLKRNQLKYFLVAATIALLGSSANIINAFGHQIFYNIGTVAILIYSLLMGYAILKHRLLSLEVLIKRSLIYAVMIGLVLSSYLLIVFWFSATVYPEWLLVTTSLAVVFSAIFFHPVEQQLQKVTDKIFFKDRYSYHGTLKKLSKAMVEQLDLDKLSSLITKTIYTEMKVKTSVLFLKEKQSYIPKSCQGISPKNLPIFEEDHLLIKQLKKEHAAIIKEDFSDNYLTIGKTAKVKQLEIYTIMDNLHAAVIVALWEGKQLTGMLTIGERLSGDIFCSEDIELLESFSQQAVIGLQNAHLYKTSQNRVAELTTIFDVTKLISSTLSLDSLLQQLISAVTKAVGADRGIMFLYEKDGDELYAVSAVGVKDALLKDIRLGVGDSVLGSIFRQGDAKIIPHTTRNTEHVKNLGVDSYIVAPMKSKEGTPIGLITVDNKITKRSTSTINLQLLITLANQTCIAIENATLYSNTANLKNYYETILEALPSGVITTDNNIIKTFNASATQITGIKEKTAIGEDITKIFRKDIPLTQALTSPAQNKEVIHINNNDQKHYLNISTKPLITGKESTNGLQSVITDLTEVKLLEAQIRKNDKLSSLGTMVAGVAHEIKNPLTSMKLFVQLMDENKNDPNFWEEYGNIVATEVARLEKIVEDFLGVARTPDLNLESIEIETVLEKVSGLVKSQARKENIHLKKEITPHLPLIKVDSQRMVQVFLNLILNAIQAISADTGGEVIVSAKQENNNEIFIEITDNGCGIPKENIEKLFTPFFTTKDKGTGLGLSIIYKIIEEHLGKIEVTSTIGKGTTFTVTLPVDN